MSLSITGHTKIVGVFGYPVEHSLSPAMHNAAFAALNLSYLYIPFSVRPESLGPAIRSLTHLGVVGVNLTIPHKESVLPFLDTISDEAREVGAVNTVQVQNERLFGDNTDGRGFYAPLSEQGFSVRGRRVVVLGAGGAARAVVFRLAREGAQVVLANRSRERAERLAQAVASAGYGPDAVQTLALEDREGLAKAIAGAELLVHTTRVGMAPQTEHLPPVPLEAFHSDLLVYDLVYTPVETALLKAARSRGCRVMNGIKMLVYQGAAAFERWTGIWPPTDVMEEAVLKATSPPTK